ncbi:MAG TPA: IS4 family transposase [Thermomicrobiales bacterium]|nr:IS4 family transposase [Thermomicrobiales bacterium]
MCAAAPPAPPPVVADIERFLCAALGQLTPAAPGPGARGPGRPRVLPALCLWAGRLVCVLHGFGSYLAVWRLLTGAGLWRSPRVAVSDQALDHRLARDGTAPLEGLFRHIGAALAARLAPYAAAGLAAFAVGGVYALDQMTLDQVARLLPALRAVPAGAATLLPGALAGLFDLRRQQWARVEYLADPQQNEKVLARELVAGRPAGSLLLADLGSFGFPWFDDLTDGGYWWVSRLRARTSYTLIHAYYHRGDTLDALVWLGAYRADRAKHAARLVQFTHRGATFRYVTNVRDPATLPMAEIARLYARRWAIELAFDLVKTHLGLHLLWGAKPVVVLQQVWAVFIIAQVLQALRLEIAGRAGVDPYAVSLPLLVEYLPCFAARGLDPVAVFVAQGRALRFIRPSSRTAVVAPEIPPAALAPRPSALALVRPPRYARRNCGPRPRAPAP